MSLIQVLVSRVGRVASKNTYGKYLTMFISYFWSYFVTVCQASCCYKQRYFVFLKTNKAPLLQGQQSFDYPPRENLATQILLFW